MRFSDSPDQLALRDAVRSALAKSCPPAVVRAAYDRESTVDGVWTDLAGMGLFGAAVPESRGGLGLAEDDLVPVVIELGYAAVPLPVAETMLVAAPLLAEADPAGHLPAVIQGRCRVAVAGPTGLVPFGGRADLVLVHAGGGPTAVPADSTIPASTVDGSWCATRVGEVAEAGLVTGDNAAALRYERRVELARAAMLIGLARRMVDLTTAYVSTRRQFGVPVGSFQAVKHHLADALLSVEFAEPAVLAAGWSVARRQPEAERDVALAAVLAAESARTVAGLAIQCHGAMGYTTEYDLHLYAKRSWALAAFCDIDAHLEELADSLSLTGDLT